jgi:hypothetical protein
MRVGDCWMLKLFVASVALILATGIPALHSEEFP